AGFTIVRYDVGIDDLLRAAYEFQGYQTLGEDGLWGWKMPSPKINQADLGQKTSVYDWVKVGETTYRELDDAPTDKPALPPPRPIHVKGNPFINMLNRLRGPGGHLFSGLGGFLALKGLADAWRELQGANDRAVTIGRLLGAASAVVGAGIEISMSIIAVQVGRQGNAALALRLKTLSAKRGVAVFGALGTGLVAAADSVRAFNAFNDNNPEQGRMLVGAALAGGALTVATWAGGTATAATLSSGAAVAVLGLSPAGWVIVAGVATLLIVGFAIGADMSKHGPAEIWLKHSAWGISGRHYDNREELDAVHSFYYRPRLTPDWHAASSFPVGNLRISCELPGITDIPADSFQTKLTFMLRGKQLSQVVGPAIHSIGTHPVDYHRECLVTPLGSTGRECGWSILMHKDTRVLFEYLYFPDPDDQPGTALQQPDAPTPMIFSSSGWFTDSIDSTKLEPVRAPK
ncbi:hypothetical protein, partial [Achromobacter sp. Root565]|uniref:hypothetical protein n=1 Tax=Achromobacter sp. Root565 TaxID=1736564 RepID=UPI00138F952F